jgi:hypothetical protein
MSNNPNPAFHKKLMRHVGMYRFSMPVFLISLVVLLVATPFMENLRSGKHIETVILTLVLMAAVQAVGKRRGVLLLGLVLLLPTLVGKWLNHLHPESVSSTWFLVSALVFVMFIILQLLRFILTSPRVNTEVLCAGVSTYFLLGLLWAFGYELIADLNPGAFVFNTPGASHTMVNFTCVYFSFVTLSTAGYGDIAPVSDVARMFAALEAITGSLFIGVLIARLVSLYSVEIKNKDA